MTDIPTPICDLIDHLLSLGMSPGTALEAARNVERGTARARVSAEDRRKRWREKKARQRSAKPAMSPGDNRPLDISNNNTLNLQLEKKESESARPPLSLGDKGTLIPTDDWPENHGDQFWDRYPAGRKHEKAKVFAKLERLRREGYLDAYKKRQRLSWATLMAGLDKFIATRPEPQFTPAPIVWLNGHRWDADYGDRTSQATGGSDGSFGKGAQQSFGYAGLSAQLRARGAGGSG
jgi:hypothetical protein